MYFVFEPRGSLGFGRLPVGLKILDFGLAKVNPVADSLWITIGRRPRAFTPGAFPPGKISRRPGCSGYPQCAAIRVGTNLCSGTPNTFEEDQRGAQVRRR